MDDDGQAGTGTAATIGQRDTLVLRHRPDFDFTPAFTADPARYGRNQDLEPWLARFDECQSDLIGRVEALTQAWAEAPDEHCWCGGPSVPVRGMHDGAFYRVEYCCLDCGDDDAAWWDR